MAGRCINNMINFYFTTDFSTDPTTFLSNYGALNDQLVSTTIPDNTRGLDLLFPTDVNFSTDGTNVRYSGIISSECISVGSCSNIQLSNLQNLLTSGSTIQNMVLTSSSVMIGGTMSNTTDNNTNTTSACPSVCTNCD